MKKLKVITILGTRPEITKLSPVLPVFDKEFDHKVIHTGQHYSYTMDRIFFEELRLRKPDYNLNVGSGTHAEQTAKMLIGIEKILIKEKPDYVVVFADPNTPLAGALAAAKLHIKVVHMEAGTRSFNRKMPEEINRVLIDHCSDILLAPDKKAVQNLAKEGIEKNVYLVGSTAYEAALRNGEFAKNSNLLNKLKIKKREYILTTVHRAENTNDKKVLGELIGAVNNISEYIDIVLPLHPRTLKLCGE
jgi:UDP-N-acetylglucosamine 2-epimerase